MTMNFWGGIGGRKQRRFNYYFIKLQFLVESPLLPSPYSIKKCVIPNESTPIYFPKAGYNRWMNEGSPQEKPISIL